MHLNEIGREAHQINAGNGWETFEPTHWVTDPNSTMTEKARVHFLICHMGLITEEVGEAVTGIRTRDKENFAEEMGDVVIRAASICHGLGIDLEAAIAAKLAKNRTRGLHHGGKAV